MANINEYYISVDEKILGTTIKMVEDALKSTCEKHLLLMKDIDVLARLLTFRKNGNDDGGMYEHVVDFLWMSYRIGFNQKMLLLNLPNE